MFAGIGPFAVPGFAAPPHLTSPLLSNLQLAAAKHHSCQVYANDLNPRSKFYLEENCRSLKHLPSSPLPFASTPLPSFSPPFLLLTSCRLNKVDALVHTSCMCARAFLASRVSQCLEKVKEKLEQGPR